jgi:SHS family lactate transporter-like MFS transporter
MWATLCARWPLFLYMVALMAAFNGFSHGTQDLYPSAFLERQRGLGLETVAKVAILYNLAAIAGGILFGAISQRIGRRRAIAASALLAIPMIPLWIGSSSVAGLAAGAVLMQFAVQGAWGVVPAHLNELSPKAVRGTFPGLAYQLGNLAASFVPRLQAVVAERRGGDYSFSLGWVVGVCAVTLAVIALAGPEARDADLAPEAREG